MSDFCAFVGGFNCASLMISNIMPMSISVNVKVYFTIYFIFIENFEFLCFPTKIFQV